MCLVSFYTEASEIPNYDCYMIFNAGDRSGRENLGITNGSVPLLETGGLNWFVGVSIMMETHNETVAVQLLGCEVEHRTCQ